LSIASITGRIQLATMNKIRTRFAPSPTGHLHIGGLRTALYAYALAKHEGGDFILRIEDTDKKREVKGGKEEIYEILKPFNLSWDEDYVQSELAKDGRYKKAAEKLISDGHAFYCQCEAKNAKEKGFSLELRDPCREKNLTSGAIKLKVPEKEEITFVDFVLGKEVSWNTSDVADTTLLKSDGLPTYHLAVVVDDTEMKISHVLRGHDWMPSTPIHLLAYKYLNYEVPKIGHLTDILDPEGGKLSKRKGSVSCEGLLKEGYLSEAILNFVMLLGWAPKDNQEIFSLEEFVKVFDSKGFQKANPIFNKEKLDWFNGVYIRKLSDEELFNLLDPILDSNWEREKVKKMIPLLKDRINSLTDFAKLVDFIFEEKEPLKITDNYSSHISNATIALEKVDDWNKESIDQSLMETIDKNNFKVGDFFMDLRGTIAGSRFTPPINDSIVILGKEETIKRLKKLV
jgi:glutamyl-tRNA synthetase